jgi:hypothetical protein
LVQLLSAKKVVLVGRTGLEPVTFCTSSRCPTELDYRPAGLFYFRFRYIATSSEYAHVLLMKRRPARLFGLAPACFAYAVNIQALPCPREFCLGRHPLNHFSSNTIIEILDVATPHADEVDVRFDAGIESCLAFRQVQLLDETVFRQDLKCLVDCGKTDCWMNFPDFTVDSLCSWMVSTLKCEFTDCYALRRGLVSFLSESFDYGSV